MEISKSQESYFTLATRVAQNSTMRHRLGAVLVKSGRVLNVGWNQERWSQDKYMSWSLHAEIDACLGAQCSIVGSTVYVSRILKNGKKSLSHPCIGCILRLKKMGVKNLYWTKDHESYGRLKFHAS